MGGYAEGLGPSSVWCLWDSPRLRPTRGNILNHLIHARLSRGFRKTILPALAVTWLLAAVPGIRYLMAYEGTAGKQGAAPVLWPASVPETGDSRLPTLVVALHPRCSCSAATLEELQGAFETSSKPFNSVLLISEPKGANYKWQDVHLYREAQETLHATVILDEDSAYAAQFGAQTSGEVLFYSANEHGQRELLFAGGVTGGRGMTGDNQGIELLKAAFHGRKREGHARTHVFGCGLFAPALAESNVQTPGGDQ